tara:strand:+ start:95 stop:286 length:192 start_codon:yes stop_codon:yes gene_type:complete
VGPDTYKGDQIMSDKPIKEKIKFKLQFMSMMLVAGRHDEASKAYEDALQMIEDAEFVEEETRS